MIKWVIYSCIFILLGLFVLFMPNFIDYTNTSNWYFDLAKFLTDYPKVQLWFGICLIVVGVVGLVIAIFSCVKKNTSFVIQQSADGDFGNPSLAYPWYVIGTKDPNVYENIASIKRCEQNILDLDKKRIKRFYQNLKYKNGISFLGVALFPFIVYAGYVVGDSGIKTRFFHYDRNKKKSILILPGIKPKNDITVVNETERDNATKTVIAVSISYSIDEEIVTAQFSRERLIFCKANYIGTESSFNKKTMVKMAKSIRSIVEEKSKGTDEVNLLLSCPAELCFAIGQSLRSPGLPKINVFNFNRKSENNKWDWSITLDDDVR